MCIIVYHMSSVPGPQPLINTKFGLDEKKVTHACAIAMETGKRAGMALYSN